MTHLAPNPTMSPLSDLLCALEAVDAQDTAEDEDGPPSIPPLYRLLSDEDVVREFRADNQRLINYLAQPPIIRQLLEKCFDVPSVIAPPQFAATVAQTPPRSPQSPSAQNPHLAREIQLKQAYVACELLSSENRILSAAFVADDDAISQLFSVLENTQSGHLQPMVIMNFSKIFLTMLKTESVRFLQKLSARSSFMPVFLKHMDCDPICQLLVNILDVSESSFQDSYDVRRPPDDALKLLEDIDLMGGLAQCFVRASSEAVDPQQQHQQQQRSSHDANNANSFSPDCLDLRAKQRRMREETMANVTSTIVGVTERLLQLPELGVRIPDKLSPYGNPEVVSRILDAGLYAYSNGMVDANGVPHAVGEAVTNEQRVEAFSSRNDSALLQSLGLAADLMTLPANVYQDDGVDMAPGDLGHGTGINSVSIGVGKHMSGHKGLGPSIIAAYAAAKAETHERQQAARPQPLPELANKIAGDPIVATDALQRELALRFPRLSEMFGPDGDEEESGSDSVVPLGSLRLKVAEFFVACMKNSSQETVDQIIGLGVPKKLLKLFNKHQWSSMLHGVVTKSIVDSLDDTELGRSSRKAWFDAGIIPWLIESWSQNTKAEKDGKTRRGSRAGYMGHLIRIGTALRFFIEEPEGFEDRGEEKQNQFRGVRRESLLEDDELLDESQLDAFLVFITEALSPAQLLEITPLCEERSEDETEATDLLEMSGMGFSDQFGSGSGPMHISLMQNPPKPGDDIVDEEEEIKPVDVDGLEHFAADDEDARNAKPVDHDIPLEMRARLAKEEEEVEVVKPITDPSLPNESSKARQVSKENSRDRSQKAYMSKLHEADYAELEEVIDNVDSSSDEEGTYEAFVDTRTKSLAAEKLAALKVTDSEPGSASLEGAVTEIEEETVPLGSDSTSILQLQLASNVISVVDDAADSSDDEEYVEWNDAGRVGVITTAQQSSQGDEPEKVENRESSAR
eukprot:TRINITY_DN26_c0_g4_i1.p2 TRINITY_DN26_c0_g4~~TRINITY_DN26_c0_g4_i1.p2  ORF type:complete len:968 (-),score=221.60 TRINITY_DN26_c0_g4_i1:14141-17044(-)